MSWINGRAAARTDIMREAMASPRRNREDAIRDMRDATEACRGTGTGGWTDSDIDDYVTECNRQLGG